MDQSSSLGQPKTWWNYFKVTLGSGQGLMGTLGELPENSKIDLGGAWGARNLRARLQVPENRLVSGCLTDLGYRKPFPNRCRNSSSPNIIPKTNLLYSKIEAHLECF